MKTSELFILCGGTLSFIMVIFHCLFYKIFKWKSEFKNVKLANHRIFFTIHLALILLFVIFTFLSFFYYKEMAKCTGLAFGLTICYSLFWLWRLIWQIAYFKIPKEVTKTPMLHYILIAICIALFISYAIPVLLN